MEADWEFEIGSDTPSIDAHWTGFVDLRLAPSRVAELTETRQLPGLGDALARLNAQNSPVWTSKTDVFVPEQIDADELDATTEEAAHVVSCYVDLLMRGDQRWNLPSMAERSCKEICARLHDISLSRCRIDLVVRRAHIEGEADALGATAYLTACGPTERDAKRRLAECLALFAAAIVPEPTT